MSPDVKLLCPVCSSKLYFSPIIVEDALKRYRMDNMYDVAQQMVDKSGPYYDKWLAAMEARGEQNRCTDCLWLYRTTANPRYQVRSCYGMGRRDGQFACGHYIVDPATV